MVKDPISAVRPALRNSLFRLPNLSFWSEFRSFHSCKLGTSLSWKVLNYSNTNIFGLWIERGGQLYWAISTISQVSRSDAVDFTYAICKRKNFHITSSGYCEWTKSRIIATVEYRGKLQAPVVDSAYIQYINSWSFSLYSLHYSPCADNARLKSTSFWIILYFVCILVFLHSHIKALYSTAYLTRTRAYDSRKLKYQNITRS